MLNKHLEAIFQGNLVQVKRTPFIKWAYKLPLGVRLHEAISHATSCVQLAGTAETGWSGLHASLLRATFGERNYPIFRVSCASSAGYV